MHPRSREEHRENRHREKRSDLLITFQDFKLRNDGDPNVIVKYEQVKKAFLIDYHEKVFESNLDAEWFVERYHPNSLALQQSRQRKALLASRYDIIDVALDEGSEIDLSKNATSKPNVLFLTGVSDAVPRQSIIDMLSKVAGFRWLELTEPRPEKNMSRLGWAIFDENLDMAFVLATLSDLQTEELHLHFVSTTGIPYSTKSITPYANKPSQLAKDCKLAGEIALKLDQEAGFDGIGVVVLEPKIAQLIKSLPDAEPVDDMELEDAGINVKAVKTELDCYIWYLHQVHFYDYYTGYESLSPEDHVRRGCIPLRRPFEKSLEIPYTLQCLEFSMRFDDTPAKDIASEEDKVLTVYIRKESESKFRCTECQKLFRGDDFCRKHVRTKHPNLIEHISDRVAFFNWYIKRATADPRKYLEGIAGDRRDRDRDGIDGRDVRRTGYRDHHREFRGRNRDGRGDGNGRDRPPRKVYHDMDAVKQTNLVLNYD